LQTQSAVSRNGPRITLTRYLDQLVTAAANDGRDDGNGIGMNEKEMTEMTSLLLAVQMACKTISNLVHRAGLAHEGEGQRTSSTSSAAAGGTTGADIFSSPYTDGRYYSMQRLDQLSTAVLRSALKFTGKCRVSSPAPRTALDVADHQPGVLLAKSLDSRLVACLDPLDGSGNADASICTGTVFGVFETNATDASTTASTTSTLTTNDNEEWASQVLQPARRIKAAGYCLYSSATVLVFTMGGRTGVQGFTLDPQTQEFVLTHPNLTIPRRGSVYSCNEANSEGWDAGIRRYFTNLKTGRGETGQRYALRYVGSLVGDVHRTLLYGGLFAYPSDAHAHPHGNLQLLYKAAPLAFVVHTAGGSALDQDGNDLLDVTPSRVHAKCPCFLGSPDDMTELRRYLVPSD